MRLSPIQGQGSTLSDNSAMTIKDGYMYTIDHDHLRVLSLEDVSKPKEVYKVYVGSGLESVFAYEDNLFMGTDRAILIYGLAKKDKPVLKSTNSHVIIAKDPVIVLNDIAYSTLRQGNENSNPSGSLEVVDVSNPSSPFTVKIIQQEYPMGLAGNDHALYVCNAKFGLNVFEMDRNEFLIFRKNIPSDPIYNCIVADNVLIGQTKTGLLFYNIKNPLSPVLIHKTKE